MPFCLPVLPRIVLIWNCCISLFISHTSSVQEKMFKKKKHTKQNNRPLAHLYFCNYKLIIIFLKFMLYFFILMLIMDYQHTRMLQCWFLATQVPLCAQWEDIEVGLQVEVLNTRTTLLTKVYWIATVIRLAGTKLLV